MSKIEMSALGPSLAEQCDQLGMVTTGIELGLAQRLADAVTLCYIHSVMTDSEVTKARKRIISSMRLRQVRAALSTAKSSEHGATPTE